MNSDGLSQLSSLIYNDFKNVNSKLSSTYNIANDAYYLAGSAHDTADSAYNRAENAYSQAYDAYSRANDAYDMSHEAYLQAGYAESRANDAFNAVYDAYSQANSAYNAANNAYSQANLAYDTVISASSKADSAYSQANSAYNTANNAYNIASDALKKGLKIKVTHYSGKTDGYSRIFSSWPKDKYLMLGAVSSDDYVFIAYAVVSNWVFLVCTPTSWNSTSDFKPVGPNVSITCDVYYIDKTDYME